MRDWSEKATQRKEWKAMGETFAQQWDKIGKKKNTSKALILRVGEKDPHSIHPSLDTCYQST